MLITKKFNRDKPRTVGYVVAHVEPGGLVDRDGRFRVGDEIVNVNGCSLRGMGMEEAREVLRKANRSAVVDLTVARDEEVDLSSQVTFVKGSRST